MKGQLALGQQECPICSRPVAWSSEFTHWTCNGDLVHNACCPCRDVDAARYVASDHRGSVLTNEAGEPFLLGVDDG